MSSKTSEYRHSYYTRRKANDGQPLRNADKVQVQREMGSVPDTELKMTVHKYQQWKVQRDDINGKYATMHGEGITATDKNGNEILVIQPVEAGPTSKHEQQYYAYVNKRPVGYETNIGTGKRSTTINPRWNVPSEFASAKDAFETAEQVAKRIRKK